MGKSAGVVLKDAVVRMNNWDRVKASTLTAATVSSFGFGVSLAFLIVGLVQWVREREECLAGKEGRKGLAPR